MRACYQVDGRRRHLDDHGTRVQVTGPTRLLAQQRAERTQVDARVWD